MTLATALAELKASLDQGNEALTTKHFRLLVEALEAQADVAQFGFLTLDDWVANTIAAGVITATQTLNAVDTEGAAAADDLDTITTSEIGREIVILRSVSAARVVTVKHGTGNLRLAAGSDFIMNSNRDTIVLVRRNANEFLELSRSDNA